MTPVECVVIVVAVLLILAVLETAAWSFVLRRFKRRARRTYTNVTYYRPPLVTQDDIDATWLDAWPAETPIEVMAEAYFDGLPWDDLPTEVIEARVMDRLAFYDVVRGEFPTEGLAS